MPVRYPKDNAMVQPSVHTAQTAYGRVAPGLGGAGTVLTLLGLPGRACCIMRAPPPEGWQPRSGVEIAGLQPAPCAGQHLFARYWGERMVSEQLSAGGCA